MEERNNMKGRREDSNNEGMKALKNCVFWDVTPCGS
jgi:hypothetical protein